MQPDNSGGTLEDGTYVLRLTVTDAAGNTSFDEIELVWDTTAPAIDLTSTHGPLTNKTTAEFTFDVTELWSNPSVVECSLDGGAFATCASPDTHAGLLDGDHTWTLRATDDLGNTRTATALSWTVDTVAPSLTRVGAASVEVEAGTTYDDPGATALDSREGDVTRSVLRTGSVQTDTPGSYLLTYDVTDTAGNAAAPVSRTVTVLDKTVSPAEVTCRGLAPTIMATPGTTTAGTAGDDVILGTSGNDMIVAGGGDDVVCGLNGNDTIVTGAGDDRVLAGRGRDTLKGQRGDDVLQGGGGDDRVLAGHGKDRLSGGRDDDTLIGNRGDDNLHGGLGNDRMRGSHDDDRLSGNRGDDDLTGGEGVDWVRGGEGADRVTTEPGENQYS